MRWPWQRAPRTTSCPYRRLLPSATAGIAFESTFTIVWRPTWRTRDNLEELVRCDVLKAAAGVAREVEAGDLHAAQDVINAALGKSARARSLHYRLISARVALQLSPENREALAQCKADEDRVRRLQFLKVHLYNHPDLLVLDRLERQPESLKDEHMAEIQRLARSIRACDRWWQPMLEQWEQLCHSFTDEGRRHYAMHTLLDSLKAFNVAPPPHEASQDSHSGQPHEPPAGTHR